MRLIDADKQDLQEAIGRTAFRTRQDIYDLIATQPTVDAVPVIRCKDCKHRGGVQVTCNGISIDYCKVWDGTVQDLESTFCNYGERKDEVNEF